MSDEFKEEFQGNGDYGEEAEQSYEGYDENTDFTADDSQPANGGGGNGDGESAMADDGSGDAGNGADDHHHHLLNKEHDDERKLFVGGLSWETNQKDLKDYFGKYGEIGEVNIKTDPNTGRSRGFAFIQFGSKEAVEQVLAEGSHSINGKQVDPKRAKARPGIKKIFVGGLDPDLPEADIRSYFEKFGKIEEVELPFDKQKNQRRQFCFITFESEEVVDDICKNPKQKIGAKECDVKKATPKQDPRSGGGRGGWGGYGSFGTSSSFSRGGRGRGRGRGGQAPSPGWGGQGYNYNYNQGYGGYNQGYSGYGGYTGYDNYYGYGTGYDYSGWGGYGQGGYSSGYGQQATATYGKSRRGGGSSSSSSSHGYHPYTR